MRKALPMFLALCYNFSNMNIVRQLNNKELVLSLEGELNSTTASIFEDVIKNELDDVDSLIIDLAKLSYLSSAGLRILLVAQKIMMKKGGMVVRHPNNEVMEIFSLTGFSNVLDIEA